MGLDTIYGREFALPGVAEKGHIVSVQVHIKSRVQTGLLLQNIRVEVDMLGGQSVFTSNICLALDLLFAAPLYLATIRLLAYYQKLSPLLSMFMKYLTLGDS